MRSAYEEQSIFAATSTEASHAVHLVLHSDLKDDGVKNTDTIRSYDRERTALQQEATLYQIVNQLTVHHVDYILLRCTNPLDYLFLTSFLHYRYPAGRVIPESSDSLFIRAVDTNEYRGTLALTNYPLLPHQTDWETSPKGNVHQHRVFSSDNAEGTYNAAIFLFGDLAKNPAPCQPKNASPLYPCPYPVLNFTPPPWIQGARTHAAIWLTILGREGYWPIAVLDPPPDDESTIATTDGPVDASGKLTIVLPTAWTITTFWVVLFVLFHFWKYYWNGVSPPADGTVGWILKSAVSSLALLVLLLLLLPLAIALCTSTIHLAYTVDLVTILFLGLGALACAVFTLFKKLDHTHALFTIALTVAGFLVIRYSGNFNSAKSQDVFFIYRSMHVVSGVSPLLPGLFYLLGLYLFCAQTLTGTKALSDGKPELPDIWPLPALSTGAATAVEQVASPAVRSWKIFGAPTFLIVAILTAIYWRPVIRSMEGAPYDRLILIVTLLAVFLILTEVGRLFLTWTKLRVVLQGISRTPLRRTLAALSAISLDPLWKLSNNPSQTQFTFLQRQRDALQRLQNCRTFRDSYNFEFDITLCNAFVSANPPTYVQQIDWNSELINGLMIRQALAITTLAVFTQVLLPAWMEEVESLDLQSRPQGGKPSMHNSQAPPEVLSAIPTVRAAEEFVCYHYISYFQNILARMRTIVLAIVALFVATAFAFAFYPFTPRTTIGGLLFLVLTIVALVVGWVYAGMERDETLSLITDTNPGLGWDFVAKFAAFAVGPLVGLITTQFPQAADVILRWLGPGLHSFK